MRKKIDILWALLSILFMCVLTSTTVAPIPAETQPSLASKLSAIKTIDFSKSKVETCSTTDICQSMPGICNKGKCMKKECSDIVCICETGYTGQFCDRNVSDVHKVNTTKVSPSSSHSNGKQHVNGNTPIATKAIIDNVTQKAVTENGANVILKAITDLGTNGQKKTNAGNISQDTIGNSSVTNLNQSNNSKNSYIKGIENKQVDSPVTATDYNGVSSTVAPNTTLSNKYATGVWEPTLSDINKKLFETLAALESASKHATVSSERTTDAHLPDGSYIKGPEGGILSDNSPITIENSTLRIQLKTPSVISHLSEVINIPTVSINTIQVELTPERKSNGGIRLTDKTSDTKPTQLRPNNKKVNNPKSSNTATDITVEVIHTTTPTNSNNSRTVTAVSHVNVIPTEQRSESATTSSVVKNPFGIRKDDKKQTHI